MKMHFSIDINTLRIYRLTACCLGWGLILLSLGSFIFYAIKMQNDSASWAPLLLILNRMPPTITLGLFVLVAASFLQFLEDRRPKPGWLLSHASFFLYLSAIILVCNFIAVRCAIYFWIQPHDFSAQPLALTGPFLGSKILIIVGLARGLRRLLPMIEESKALV